MAPALLPQLRGLARVPAVLLGLCLLPVTLSRLAGGGTGDSPWPQLASFAPWAAVGWVAVVVLLVVARSRRVLLVAALALALHAWWLVPPTAARGGGADAGEGRPVTVLTVNSLLGRADPDSIAAAAERFDADLVSVQELQPGLADALQERLKGRFPHSELRPLGNSSVGAGLWSRWPVRGRGVLRADGRTLQVEVQVPGAGPVLVSSVHTTSPRPLQVEAWNRDLEAVAGAARDARGPHLMVGDFNASRDHAGFRRILGTGLVDAADVVGAPWSGFTWPADRGRIPPLVRIDHVLVTPDSVGVTAVRTVEVAGTDHRGVVADLVIRPGD